MTDRKFLVQKDQNQHFRGMYVYQSYLVREKKGLYSDKRQVELKMNTNVCNQKGVPNILEELL